MTNRLIYTILCALTACIGLQGCIEDGFTTSAAHQPEFSVDTLKMGVVYTAEQTATHRFVVYNRHDKGLNISNVAMSGQNSGLFRINVDGMSGTSFTDIEIRANDSIYVFVSADLPENGAGTPLNISAKLDFVVNGVTSSVVISAEGQDIERMRGVTISTDTHLDAERPYRITDSLVVAEGATLTLGAGTRLLFHDKAWLKVHGTLVAEGTPDAPVRMSGDRTGNVITDVSFDLMSRQWAGVEFTETSAANRLEFTEICNTEEGVLLVGDGKDVETKKLTLVNCRLRNSGNNAFTAYGASVEAYGCEFAEAANSLVWLLSGDHRFDQCTAANYYLFSAVGGASFTIADGLVEPDIEMEPTKALVTNSISYGLGADVYPGDLTGYEVYFRRCLFKSAGTDDDNFIDSLWDADPLFYTVRSDYLFDYRVKPESPAIAAADPELGTCLSPVDYYGQPRAADLGAYVYVEP